MLWVRNSGELSKLRKNVTHVLSPSEAGWTNKSHNNCCFSWSHQYFINSMERRCHKFTVFFFWFDTIINCCLAQARRSRAHANFSIETLSTRAREATKVSMEIQLSGMRGFSCFHFPGDLASKHSPPWPPKNISQCTSQRVTQKRDLMSLQNRKQ